jgi:peptidyl-prolyl cis-trans isomerase C
MEDDMLRRIIAFGVVAAFAVAILGCSKEEGTEGQSPATETQTGESPVGGEMVAKVNGRVITSGEVAQEQTEMMKQFGGQVDASQMGQMADQMSKQALENVISRVLIEQAIEESDVAVSSAEVDERVAEIKASFPSEEAYQQRLTAMGMTPDQLRNEMETALKLEKVVAEASGEPGEATEAEARQYYEENSERFVTSEQVEASHILIMADETATDEERAEARRKAESVLAEVKAGGDFAALAARHSGCPSSSNGGALGSFGRGRMVKPFEDAAFALDVGEVSDVVETRFGYHIIKVTGREGGGTMTFDEVKENLVMMLTARKRQEAMGNFTNQLRESAEIEYATPQN